MSTAYFVFNHDRIAGMQGLFAQLWKEYALSDSRYLTLDPFVLSIETLTVVGRLLSFSVSKPTLLQLYI